MGIRGVALTSSASAALGLPEAEPFFFLEATEALTLFYFLSFARERLFKLAEREREERGERGKGHHMEHPSGSPMFFLPEDMRTEKPPDEPSQEAHDQQKHALALLKEAYETYRDKVQQRGPFWIRCEQYDVFLRQTVPVEAPLSERDRQELVELLDDYQGVLAIAFNAFITLFGGFPLERE